MARVGTSMLIDSRASMPPSASSSVISEVMGCLAAIDRPLLVAEPSTAQLAEDVASATGEASPSCPSRFRPPHHYPRSPGPTTSAPCCTPQEPRAYRPG